MVLIIVSQLTEQGKEHDRSSAGEEGHIAICARCEGGERDRTRPLRPSKLMKVFSGGSAVWREGRITSLLRVSM